MKYLVKNTTDVSVTVIGLDVLLPGEEKEFSDDQAAWFFTMRGVPLLSTNVPDGVEVTVCTGREA